MIITKKAKKIMATMMAAALLVTSFAITPKEVKAAATAGPETISEAKASIRETGDALRFLVTATLPKTYTGDLGIELKIGDKTKKVSLHEGNTKLYSAKESGENLVVGYTVAITGIPGTAAETEITATGFADDKKATPVVRTVKQVANAAGYTFDETTGKMTYSPFAEVSLKGASQYATLQSVKYTVGETIPARFKIAFEATEGSSINISIKTSSNENNYGLGVSRKTDCDLNTSGWNKEKKIGNTLSQGTEVTIIALAAEKNEVSDFKFTSIIPVDSDGNDLAAIDLSKETPFKYTGTAGNYTPVLTTGAIAPTTTGKTLADYEKLIIECDESTGTGLNYSIVEKDNIYTDAFIVGNKVAGTIEISLRNNFNPKGPYQKLYESIDDALKLDASTVRLKVTAPNKGYKGKITIKSVRFE